MRVLLFIPCYQCEKQIPRVIQNLAAQGRGLDFIDQVLIIDNASTDQTALQAEAAVRALPQTWQERITVKRNSTNIGLGGSFRVAAQIASEQRFTHLAVLHGDDQADAHDLILFGQVLRADPEVAALLGSRFTAGAKLEGYSRRRLWANQFLNRFLTFLSGRAVTDLGSGLNIYALKDFPPERLQKLPDDIAFDLEILFDLLSKKMPFRFVPIRWRSTDERSTINELSVGLLVIRRMLAWRFLR